MSKTHPITERFFYGYKIFFLVLQTQTSELTGVNSMWQTIEKFQKLMHHNC